jgi:predicted ribosomally synthesized peptide with SipW-like signal peptide
MVERTEGAAVRRLAATLVAILAAVGLGSVAATAYFNETKTSPQPIAVYPFGAPIRYESNASADASGFSADRVTVDRPAGVRAGWLLVAFVGTEDTPDVTPPSGWTAFGGMIASTPEVEQVSQRAFHRVAGANEPPSYTFRFNRTKNATAGISAYSGVRASDPIDASANADGHTPNFGGGPPTAKAPSATARYDTRRLVAATFAEDGGFNPLSFDGVTEHWDRSTPTTSGGVGGGPQPAGSTDPASVSGPYNADWVIQTVILNGGP